MICKTCGSHDVRPSKPTRFSRFVERYAHRGRLMCHGCGRIYWVAKPPPLKQFSLLNALTKVIALLMLGYLFVHWYDLGSENDLGSKMADAIQAPESVAANRNIEADRVSLTESKADASSVGLEEGQQLAVAEIAEPELRQESASKPAPNSPDNAPANSAASRTKSSAPSASRKLAESRPEQSKPTPRAPPGTNAKRQPSELESQSVKKPNRPSTESVVKKKPVTVSVPGSPSIRNPKTESETFSARGERFSGVPKPSYAFLGSSGERLMSASQAPVEPKATDETVENKTPAQAIEPIATLETTPASAVSPPPAKQEVSEKSEPLEAPAVVDKPEPRESTNSSSATASSTFAPPIVSNRLLSIVAENNSGVTVLMVKASIAPVRYRQFNLSLQKSFVVDLLGAWQRAAEIPDVIEIDSPHIRRVRIGSHARYTRLVIELEEGAQSNPSVSPSDQGLAVTFKPQ